MFELNPALAMAGAPFDTDAPDPAAQATGGRAGRWARRLREHAEHHHDHAEQHHHAEHHDHVDRHLRRAERKLRKAQLLAMAAGGEGLGGQWIDPETWGGARRGSRGAGRGDRGGWEDEGRGGRGRGPRGRGRGGPGWGARGGRMRRGDVRAAILALLAEQPRHGYDLMQELAERTGGLWRPSPGSVYPTLAQLEDEGLIVAREEGGKRVFTLTDDGRAEVEGREGPAPWDEVNDAADGVEGHAHIMREAALVMAAAKQFHHLASPDQREAAAKVLADARRKLYRLLSVDPDE